MTTSEGPRDRAEIGRLSRRPRLPGADEAMSLIFGGLARIRKDRALHPDGVVLAGTFRPVATVGACPLLREAEERRALVRISRGAGLPAALPDVLGCAIRVPDAYGPGAHQDLALASSREARLARHALVPARDFFGAFYSSILPYRVDGEVNLLGARVGSGLDVPCVRLDALRAAVAAGTAVTVTVLRAAPLGSWQPVAEVRLDALASAADSRRLRFNPWNSGPGIQPLGSLNALRDPAYRASQRGSP